MACLSSQVLITDNDVLELKGKHGYEGKEESEAPASEAVCDGKGKSSETTACHEGLGNQKALNDKPVKAIGDGKSESSETTACQEELEDLEVSDDDTILDPNSREWQSYLYHDHSLCKEEDDSSSEESEPKLLRKPYQPYGEDEPWQHDPLEAEIMKAMEERVDAYLKGIAPTDHYNSLF